jgi:sensor histidine kinase YesM
MSLSAKPGSWFRADDMLLSARGSPEISFLQEEFQTANDASIMQVSREVLIAFIVFFFVVKNGCYVEIKLIGWGNIFFELRPVLPCLLHNVTVRGQPVPQGEKNVRRRREPFVSKTAIIVVGFLSRAIYYDLKKLVLLYEKNDMPNSDLIFSNKRSYRIRRHLLFWFIWWIYFGFVHALNPMLGKPNTEFDFFKNLPFTIVESLLMLIPQTVLAYPLIYFVLPRFIFPGKYLKAFLWTLVFLFICVVFNTFMVMQVNQKIIAFILPESFYGHIRRPQPLSFFMGVLGSLKGTLTGAALAVALKMGKHYYVKEQTNLKLLKENTESQLQLLTAQVHPHFLFNTLNNIYSRAQNESPGTAKMIIELSHIMRYVLDEGKQTLVPLEKELQMISDYINLEKMRYDEKLDLHVSLPEKTENIYIAPLLLLPFVENCFKHGASKMLHHPWINLKIDLQELTLSMKLINGKKISWDSHNNRKGTGIDNVKRRLELLYRDRFDLRIDEDEEVFVVNLTLELVKLNPSKTPAQPVNTQKEYV